MKYRVHLKMISCHPIKLGAATRLLWKPGSPSENTLGIVTRGFAVEFHTFNGMSYPFIYLPGMLLGMGDSFEAYRRSAVSTSPGFLWQTWDIQDSDFNAFMFLLGHAIARFRQVAAINHIFDAYPAARERVLALIDLYLKYKGGPSVISGFHKWELAQVFGTTSETLYRVKDIPPEVRPYLGSRKDRSVLKERSGECDESISLELPSTGYVKRKLQLSQRSAGALPAAGIHSQPFRVACGYAICSRPSFDGNHLIFEIMKPGEYGGLGALVSRPSWCDVADINWGKTRSTIHRLSAGSLMTELEDDPQLRRTLLSQLASRLLRLQDRLILLSSGFSEQERIEISTLFVSTYYSYKVLTDLPKGMNGIFARLLGTTPETLSRYLAVL